MSYITVLFKRIFCCYRILCALRNCIQYFKFSLSIFFKLKRKQIHFIMITINSYKLNKNGRYHFEPWITTSIGIGSPTKTSIGSYWKRWHIYIILWKFAIIYQRISTHILHTHKNIISSHCLEKKISYRRIVCSVENDSQKFKYW